MKTRIYAAPAVRGLKHWNLFIQAKIPKGYFQFELIVNVLFYLALSDSFEYLCDGSTTIINIYVYSYSAGIDFSRQNLTSTDVRFWRLMSIPAL